MGIFTTILDLVCFMKNRERHSEGSAAVRHGGSRNVSSMFNCDGFGDIKAHAAIFAAFTAGKELFKYMGEIFRRNAAAIVPDYDTGIVILQGQEKFNLSFCRYKSYRIIN